MTDTTNLEHSQTMSWLASQGLKCPGVRVLYPYARADLIRRLGRRMGIAREDQITDVIHRLVYSPPERFAADFHTLPNKEACGGLRAVLASNQSCWLAFNFQTDVVRLPGVEADRALRADCASSLSLGHDWGAIVLDGDLARIWVIDSVHEIELTRLCQPAP